MHGLAQTLWPSSQPLPSRWQLLPWIHHLTARPFSPSDKNWCLSENILRKVRKVGKVYYLRRENCREPNEKVVPPRVNQNPANTTFDTRDVGKKFRHLRTNLSGHINHSRKGKPLFEMRCFHKWVVGRDTKVQKWLWWMARFPWGSSVR